MQIIISPIHETFFSGRIWMGLNLNQLSSNFLRWGHQVNVIDFSEIAKNYDLLPQGCCLFYTVSYNNAYQQYIKDIVYDISVSRSDIILIPNINQLFSFENKGYQELYKRRIRISNIEGRYYGDEEDFYSDLMKFNYPFVLKYIHGSVSSGVKLVKSTDEFKQILKIRKKLSLLERLRKLKWHLLHKNNNSNLVSDISIRDLNYSKFFASRFPFVTQKFIENLDGDFKVLVFGSKYYILRRRNRVNDFRASGSGIFEWTEVEDNFLDFVENLMKLMNVPFMSYDIYEKNGSFGLIEFQGIGFGPLTLVESSFYYIKECNSWLKIQANSDLEFEYANAIHNYLISNV